jgi:hypothetical protein
MALGMYGSCDANEYSDGPITCVDTARIVIVGWRPSVTRPNGPPRPTLAARPQKRPPLFSVPDFSAMPLSRLKKACRPPPSSSDPRRPRRDGTVPVRFGMRVSEAPLAFTFVRRSTPTSMIP